MPKPDGRWDIAKIKKFALKSAAKLKGPLEKDQLQLELTKLKIMRASQELASFESEIRTEIEAKFREHFLSVFNTLAASLKMLPRDAALRCEGMQARQLYGALQDMIYCCFDNAREAFGLPDEKVMETKVLPFKTRVEANGSHLVSSAIRS